MKRVRLLGIDVPDELFDRWRVYLAPEWQPFFVDPDEYDFGGPARERTLTDDLRDTYKVWRMQGTRTVVWFDEESFMSLPRADRARLVREQARRDRGAVPTVNRWSDVFDARTLRAQADSYRFVWWPALLDQHPEQVLAAHVLDGQPASRHDEVKASTWRACERLLPGAREIAGQFAPSSGPNCFGTTLAAAGLVDSTSCVVQEPFEDFLSAHCTPSGRDEEPGTVFVWRDGHGQPVHSAVTIGDGWALEKPAQTWWTPRVVLDVRQLIKANRGAGQRLERHRILQ